jgi:hypothetical protein
MKAINDYSFVSISYLVVLSIDNYCSMVFTFIASSQPERCRKILNPCSEESRE